MHTVKANILSKRHILVDHRRIHIQIEDISSVGEWRNCRVFGIDIIIIIHIGRIRIFLGYIHYTKNDNPGILLQTLYRLKVFLIFVSKIAHSSAAELIDTNHDIDVIKGVVLKHLGQGALAVVGVQGLAHHIEDG